MDGRSIEGELEINLLAKRPRKAPVASDRGFAIFRVVCDDGTKRSVVEVARGDEYEDVRGVGWGMRMISSECKVMDERVETKDERRGAQMSWSRSEGERGGEKGRGLFTIQF